MLDTMRMSAYCCVMPSPIRTNGAKVAEARIRAGLTRADLAERIGVDRSTIHRIEEGAQPKPQTLLALASVLGCDINDLTDRTAA